MPSITVCNVALAEVRAQAIVSLDEGTPEADACTLHYDDCFDTLIGAHEWSFAKKRASLAALSLNDRAGEWVYAYSIPSDLAVMGAIVQTVAPAPVGVYYPWPYDYPRDPLSLSDFVFDGTTLYTNLENASIEYSSNDIDEALWPPMFRRALALELASRLAITLNNDRAMKGDLIKQAEVAKQRAVADDLNRYPKRDAWSRDDVARVRS